MVMDDMGVAQPLPSRPSEGDAAVEGLDRRERSVSMDSVSLCTDGFEFFREKRPMLSFAARPVKTKRGFLSR